MADGILGLGSGQASTLNQELIDKLKEAERKARVEPLETSIEDISGEGGEAEKLAEITAKANALLETIKPFDLYVTSGVNAFEEKSATTSGTAVIFDAVDVGKLNTGSTSVTIDSLAQRDVFQSDTFSDATEQVNGGNDSGDMIVLSQSSRPVYQSDEFGKSSSDIVDAGGGTITINAGGSDKVFTITGTTTYQDLIDDINADDDLSAKINTRGRLEITHSDTKTSLTITEALTTSIGLSQGEKYSTVGTTYEELATNINSNSNYTATIEAVGTDTNRIVIKSAESGEDNAISITQTGVDLGLAQLTSTATVTGTDVPAGGLNLTIDGTTFTTTGSEDYDTFIGRINADANFNASISSGKVLISRTDGTEPSVTTDDLSLDMTNLNHTLTASNMTATVDGVNYDVSSNSITVDGGLKITAVETGTSTIQVEEDTSTLETKVQSIITQYNALVNLVDEELYSSDSKIEDKSTLRTMMTSIKDMIFGNYGTDDDKNIFNFGLSINETSGELTLDTTVFNEAVADDLESLQTLFIGLAEDEGLGTQLKTYLDDLDGFEGLLTTYEESMNERKDALTTEKDDAIEDLDNKYAQMALQFAAYGAIINQMEASFSGLKMMIEQSTSS